MDSPASVGSSLTKVVVNNYFGGRELIILKNDTAGAAVFTIKVPTPNDLSGIVTVPDDTITIAAGKTYLLRPQSAYKQSDGRIYIDCDVAGKVLVYGE